MGVVLRGLDIPVDYLRGESSTVIRPQEAERIVGCLRRGRGPIVIPESYHYLMLDQPLALIAALKALLTPRP